MPTTRFTSFLWVLFQVLAVLFLFFALGSGSTVSGSPVAELVVFGSHSPLVFCMFSSIFALLALSFTLNDPRGRHLSLMTAFASGLLQATGFLLATTGFTTPGTSHLPIAAALMMILRTFGVALLPPRGDRSGLVEATVSLGLSTASGTVWILVEPVLAPIAFSGCLLLSWPYLADGVNAFADKVFHKAALAAGARDLAFGAFTAIGRAKHIVIDKAAIMSGPDLMVTNVMAFDNEPKTLLAVAASAEAQSSHPVAVALRQLAAQWRVALKTPDRFEPTDGLGVVALLGGQTVVIGTTELLKQLRIDSFTADAIARSLEADGKTVLRVAVGGRVVGVLGLEGTLRQDAGVAGRALRTEGLTPWLFSNDGAKTQKSLADMLGLNCPAVTGTVETALEASRRITGGEGTLVLTLSKDRSSLELYACTADTSSAIPDDLEPIAICDTDDIGAFPALKTLAARRDSLARRARNVVFGLGIIGALFGATTLMPVYTAPILFSICLLVLLGFAKACLTERK